MMIPKGKIFKVLTHGIAFFTGLQFGYLLCLSFNVNQGNEMEIRNLNEPHSTSSTINYKKEITSSLESPIQPQDQSKILNREKTSNKSEFSGEKDVYFFNLASMNSFDKYIRDKELFHEKNNHDMKFCFIHIGKTAGKSILCELGGSKFVTTKTLCPNNKTRPSALRRVFNRGRYFHKHLNSCKSKRGAMYSAFLYSMRNPLKRLISWYFYERPSKWKGAEQSVCATRLHKWSNSSEEGCFFSLDDYARHIIPPSQHQASTENTKACQYLAWHTATGQLPCLAHNSMGYAYHYRLIQRWKAENSTRKHMLALRVEHLAEDWDKLDKAYGGEKIRNNVNGTIRFQKVSKTQKETILTASEQHQIQELSVVGRKNICHALCFEIQVYKIMLYMAMNLDMKQVNESIQEVIDLCPEETSQVRLCPATYKTGPTPIFRFSPDEIHPFHDSMQCHCSVSPL